MTKSLKGSQYEREFCKELSLWFSHNKQDDVFWRTAGSGARATMRMKKGIRTADSYGDVGALREEGKPFTKTTLLELKRGYTGKKGSKSNRHLSLLNLLDNTILAKRKKNPVLIEWWKKAQKERKLAGRKRTFIVFRRDRKQGCIMMSRKVYKWLAKHNGVMCCPPFYAVAWLNWKGTELMVLKVEDFFKWCDPTIFGSTFKKSRKIKRRPKKRVIKRR